MKDDEMLSVDAVIEAIGQYASAKSERDKAMEEYEGYSWGWHGRYYEEAVTRNRDAAQKALNDYVRAMVRIELRNQKAED